ncbi:hypothetical protein LXL04_023599 [Taraxacum kok-saghyz]
MSQQIPIEKERAVGHDDADDNDNEKDNQSSIPMVVKVSKTGGPCLEFGVTAYADEIVIDSLSVKDPDMAEDQLPYEGPRFDELDENLQKAFHKYLEIRGIKPSVTNFLHEYMVNKEHREYTNWLKNLKKRNTNSLSVRLEISDRSVFRNETIRRIKLSPAHRAGTPLRAVQMRSIIGFENGGTNPGHLFYFAANQFSIAVALSSAQHIYSHICSSVLNFNNYSHLNQQLGSFENSYITENPRTHKPLIISKNRLREPKNRSNTCPVAKKSFRKNDFFFQKLCICAKKNAHVHREVKMRRSKIMRK